MSTLRRIVSKLAAASYTNGAAVCLQGEYAVSLHIYHCEAYTFIYIRVYNFSFEAFQPILVLLQYICVRSLENIYIETVAFILQYNAIFKPVLVLCPLLTSNMLRAKGGGTVTDTTGLSLVLH